VEVDNYATAGPRRVLPWKIILTGILVAITRTGRFDVQGDPAIVFALTYALSLPTDPVDDVDIEHAGLREAVLSEP
jgi:hypothetical protein